MFGRRRPPAREPQAEFDPLRVVRAYHAATKHDFQRYAAGPSDLDWATQPDPFRRYAGAELISLARVEPTDEPRYEPAFCAGEVAPAALDRRCVSQLFFDSLALSAWKRYGDARWSLRCNPSSGNLHPTEAYWIGPSIEGLGPNALIAHYAPKEHALEVRARLADEAWRALAEHLPPGGFFVGLTSIHWREAWKYGERAFRYSQHDVGHALAALAVAAAGLGWRARVVDRPATEELAGLLGVASQRGPEAEHADVLVAIAPRDPGDASPSAESLRRCADLGFEGRPNDLSSGHVEWELIDLVERATVKARSAAAFEASVARAPAWEPEQEPIALRRIVRQRRSAVALDGRTGVARDAFLQVLRRTLPRERETVVSALPWDPCIDLLLLVHRVEGLEPGLYMALRDARRQSDWARATDPNFAWRRVPEVPEELALYELRVGDARGLARSLACHQDIAADGCFALTMLADLEVALERHGAGFYRRLYWECGFLGQLLYLEAEALGLRGTGIGCFFDDGVHRALGLRDARRQSLYQFTLGAAVDDPRIQAEAAYPAQEKTA